MQNENSQNSIRNNYKNTKRFLQKDNLTSLQILTNELKTSMFKFMDTRKHLHWSTTKYDRKSTISKM
jgi:hypothetical protein